MYTTIRCDICNIKSFLSIEDERDHMYGKRHEKNLRIYNGIRRVETEFNDLSKLNYWLTCFGQTPKTSKTKAYTALSKIHINIFDLLDQKFDKRHRTVFMLARYTRKEELFFPKQLAKTSSVGIRIFLRTLNI